MKLINKKNKNYTQVFTYSLKKNGPGQVKTSTKISLLFSQEKNMKFLSMPTKKGLLILSDSESQPYRISKYSRLQ